ncbi:unnamed protein product, partial [Mesorhabditis spiculigera]
MSLVWLAFQDFLGQAEQLGAWSSVTRKSFGTTSGCALVKAVDRGLKKCMPADIAVLAHLLSQRSPDHTIEEVQIVTAPHMNGSASDRMERLVSLVIGYDQAGECVQLHKVASGAVYSSARDSTDAGSLTGVRTIYEDTNTAPSAVSKSA